MILIVPPSRGSAIHIQSRKNDQDFLWNQAPSAALAREPRPTHVDSLPPKGDSLGFEPLALTGALGKRAVGADHAPPRETGVVALEEDRPGETGGAGGHVAVGADEAGWDLADAVEDFEKAGVGGLDQLAGPKASMIRR